MNRMRQPLPVPTRSDLYSPEPREHDWGMQESLVSYLGRLAEYHAVRMGDLMIYLAAKAPFDMPLTECAIRSRAATDTLALNGMESGALNWSTLIAKQTLRTGIEQMTLLPWRHVVSRFTLLHRRQHWCPQCLDRWRIAGQAVYWPLLWSLQTVTVCPIDRLPLEEGCHHCQRAVRPISTRARVGFCPTCKVWLGFEGRVEPDGRAPTASTEVTDAALRMAVAAREMLAAASLIQEDLTIHKLSSLLAECVKASRCTHRELSQRLDTSYEVISHLTQDPRRMRLGPLLHLLSCMELDIADFVREPITTLVLNHLGSFIRSLHKEPPVVAPVAVKLRDRPTPDVLDKVQAELESALAQECPPTIAALTRCLPVSTRTLPRYFPHLCQAILEKRQLPYRSDEVRHLLIEAATTEVPPLPLRTIAAQLHIGTKALEKYFPDEVAAIKRRRAGWDRTEVQKALEAFLEMEPPLSLAEVSRRVGPCKAYVQRHFPELTRAIVQRFADYRHTLTLERERQRRAAVREAVLELHNLGQVPTMRKVAAIVDRQFWTISRKSEKEVFAKTLVELGLWEC